jgi:hypothetical protein
MGFKKATIWHEAKFIPAGSEEPTSYSSTVPDYVSGKNQTKFQKFIYHIKEIWKLLK